MRRGDSSKFCVMGSSRILNRISNTILPMCTTSSPVKQSATYAARKCLQAKQRIHSIPFHWRFILLEFFTRQISSLPIFIVSEVHTRWLVIRLDVGYEDHPTCVYLLVRRLHLCRVVMHYHAYT